MSSRSRKFAARISAAIFASIVWAPTQALAHQGTGLAGGFTAGFLHPLTGLDHLLAMVSVGIWGAFLGRPLIVLLPIIFPSVMVVGAGAAMLGLPLPPVEIGIAVSVLILGIMILFAVRAPIVVACAIVAIFGLFHGYAHGSELPSAADPVGYSAGFVLCTGMLHVSGIALGMLSATRNGLLALRGMGGIITLFGVLFCAGVLVA